MKNRKITVIGGTGYAGSAIAREAARRDHVVTAISRKSPTARINGARYLASSATGPEALAAVAGADVVVAALSPRGDTFGRLASIYGQLAQQAAKAGARFVVVGGFSCLRPAPGMPRIIENPEGFPPEVLPEARENLDVLNLLLSDTSGVDWLFACPALVFSALTPGEDLGHYRISDDVALQNERGESAISGVDFARAILDEIETPTRRRAQIHFAY